MASAAGGGAAAAALSLLSLLAASLSAAKPTRSSFRTFSSSDSIPLRLAQENSSHKNASEDASEDAASASCPIDFGYLQRFPWAAELCQSESATDGAPGGGGNQTEAVQQCCEALLSTFGIGLAQYLRDTGIFELPDNSTVYACLEEFFSGLRRTGLTAQTGLMDDCFPDPSIFVRSPLLCSGIETKTDWQQKVGATPMDNSCKGTLLDLAVCKVCNNDAGDAVTKASSLGNHTSSCFYFTVIYAAGVVNSFGPKDPNTAYCLLGVQSLVGSSKHHHIIVYICVGVAIALFLICTAVALCYVWIRRRRQMEHQLFLRRNNELLKGSLHPSAGPVWFKYEDIKGATGNFSQSNLIGVGGYASVYKGVMADGSEIAVKRMKNCTSEGDAEFLNEVEVISNVRHRNLVALKGCCVASNDIDGHQRLLIYDYMCNGSLDDYLFCERKSLSAWPQRRKIAVGICKGLSYLHNGVQPGIIHRDVKPSNVLLDAQLNAKLADFGLAKITEEGMTHLTTRVAGTQGYLAPEYALYGQLTEKSDVYSFGVLLLVIMSGRRALDTTAQTPSHYLITDWAWMMVKEGNARAIIDSRIRDDGPAEIMERFVLVGILCAHLLVAFRPTIAEALKMLEGDEQIPEIPDRPLPLNCASLGYTEASNSFSQVASDIQYSFDAADMLR